MRKLKFMLGRYSLNKISFVRPTCEYANIVWDNCTQYETNAIARIQIETASIVTGATRLVYLDILTHTSNAKCFRNVILINRRGLVVIIVPFRGYGRLSPNQVMIKRG